MPKIKSDPKDPRSVNLKTNQSIPNTNKKPIVQIRDCTLPASGWPRPLLPRAEADTFYLEQVSDIWVDGMNPQRDCQAILPHELVGTILGCNYSMTSPIYEISSINQEIEDIMSSNLVDASVFVVEVEKKNKTFPAGIMLENENKKLVPMKETFFLL